MCHLARRVHHLHRPIKITHSHPPNLNSGPLYLSPPNGKAHLSKETVLHFQESHSHGIASPNPSRRPNAQHTDGGADPQANRAWPWCVWDRDTMLALKRVYLPLPLLRHNILLPLLLLIPATDLLRTSLFFLNDFLSWHLLPFPQLLPACAVLTCPATALLSPPC